MNTMLKTGAVAAALIGAIAMTATPSEARCRGCGAAAAGFAGGLAVGAIAANSYNRSYYSGPGYYDSGYAYYEPGYAYDSGYAYSGYAYGGPSYYDSYAYEPAPRYRYSRSWSGNGRNADINDTVTNK
jgi:hypothetical protein